MKYTQIQRNSTDMITIGEYSQPNIFKAFRNIIERMKRLAELDRLTFRSWRALMQEKPKPGRAGY